MKKDSIYYNNQEIGRSLGNSRGAIVRKEERDYYLIHNYDMLPPFFISLVNSSDGWMFISSTGGLTAGRQNADHMLFPYATVDKIHRASSSCGSYMSLFCRRNRKTYYWQPFTSISAGMYSCERRIYKSISGDELIFEDENRDLHLCFSYSWRFSDKYGFIRNCRLSETGLDRCRVEILDGMLDLIPPGVSAEMQSASSCLADAYKLNEIIRPSGIAVYSLAAQVVDRAEPRESLHCTAAWQFGLDDPLILLSATQLKCFETGLRLDPEKLTRGRPGAFLLNTSFEIDQGAYREWFTAADTGLDQEALSFLTVELKSGEAAAKKVKADLDLCSAQLTDLISAADGQQCTGDPAASHHHFINVLFNCMRGGIFHRGMLVNTADLQAFVGSANTRIAESHAGFFTSLSQESDYNDLLEHALQQSSPDIKRLVLEYLPLIFSRRHGDPSRPWNKFNIMIKDSEGRPYINWEGNWRDIFQNWEALCRSYPAFLPGIIAKFVNASTLDGYNPYRISREGIDWEIPETGDPWSNIGYWGDHQIIYLCRLLEAADDFFPEMLSNLLWEEIFSSAAVPYRIRDFKQLCRDPRDSIIFDDNKHEQITRLCQSYGFDGRLIHNADGQVYHVSLLEKLLITALVKLSNYVPGGGVWMNTQRPEWNDANNALAGYGLSMVTACYLRRYLAFLLKLLKEQKDRQIAISSPLNSLYQGLAGSFSRYTKDEDEQALFFSMGTAGSEYRERVYQDISHEKTELKISDLNTFLDKCLKLLDQGIMSNRRRDGLYHSYNVIEFNDDQSAYKVKNLYEMLEGQVAVISSTSLSTEDCVQVLDSLFQSSLYRADQESFILYPDRELPAFMAKNIIPSETAASSALIKKLLASEKISIITKDAEGVIRFAADLYNADVLRERGSELSDIDQKELLDIYESVFDHLSFTGRSASMFSYEGLGCIYWHMVSKLLLAVQEKCFTNGLSDSVRTRLRNFYYMIRKGIGFNKTPENYGAFPLDPYSHTPSHGGAKQPGMTGQVKEEVITRLGELGLRVTDGCISFDLSMLNSSEFLDEPADFSYLPISGSRETITIPESSLAYTFCQVPVIYKTSKEWEKIEVYYSNGETETFNGLTINSDISREIFNRTGKIKRLEIGLQL